MSTLQAPARTDRTSTFRRTVTALATVGFAVLLFLSELLDPVGEGSPDNMLEAATSASGAMVVSSLLLLVSSVLLIPAVVAIVRLTPGRGAAFANVGAVLSVMGAIGHAMAATFYLVVTALAQSGLDQGQLVGLLQHLDSSPSLGISFLFIVSFGLGLLLSFIGLRRAGAVPLWVLGTVIAAFLLEVAGPGGSPISLVKQGLGVIAFGYLASRITRRSEAVAAN